MVFLFSVFTKRVTFLDGVAPTLALTFLMHLIISFIGNIFAYYLFKSTQAISFVSVIVMIIWYIISEKRLLIKFDEKKYSKNIFYIITMIILFYINNTSNILKNIILFNIEFLVVTIIVYWNEFKNIRKKDVK